MERRNDLFRKESLDRLSSPEQLDQLMRVVSLRDWIPLATLGVLFALILVWSIVGRIPVHVQGRGAFVEPSVTQGADAHVVDVQSPGSGILYELNVRRGERVSKGQVIGRIEQSELSEQLDLERDRLMELRAQKQALDALRSEKADLDRVALAQQRAQLNESLRQAQELGPILKGRNLESIEAQRRSLELQKKDTEPLIASLAKALEGRRDLHAKGLISDSALLAAQREYHGAVEQLSSVEAQLIELVSREAEVRKAFLANESQISDLRARLKDLDVREKTLDLDRTQTEATLTASIRESERRIHQLQVQLRDASEIRSASEGHVIELTAIIGQQVTRGARVAALKVRDVEHEEFLGAVVYLTIGDGSRVKPGMTVQVTPDAVKREEFGGISGTVLSVSEYPVSFEGIANIVNNDSVARELISGERTIELLVDLHEDPATESGFRWTSSKGPAMRFAAGTTNSARVAVEERAPITYVLPFLKSFAGL